MIDFFRYNIKYNRLEKSLNQIVKGSYAGDETTLLGIVGEIVVGCIPGLGEAADIREIVYDIQNWEWKWSNAGDLLLDSIGFIHLIGDGVKALKKIPFKEIGNSIAKGIKKIPDVFENAKKGFKNFVDQFTKKGAKEIAENLVSTNMLKEIANSVNKCFEDILNFGKPQFSFAGIGSIGDDVLKNADNNVKKSNLNSINNNNSSSGVEIKSDIITDGLSIKTLIYL